MSSLHDNPVLEQLFKKVSNKNRNFHLINRSKVVGHSLSIGSPGFGKTSGNRREIELRYALNHKIFCLYDAGRMDLAFFAFPSVSDFWKKPKQDGKEVVGPRSYPVELLYPVTKSLPRKIPNLGKPFTIAVSDLDEYDVASLVGFQSLGMVKGMLSHMENYVSKETTAEDYVNIMSIALKKVEGTDGIKPSHHGAKKLKYDVFQPLINEGILSSKKASTAIDIEEMIKDRKTISVLVLRNCPQKLWGFLVHFFANHVYKALTGIGGTKRIKVPTTVVFNEVADLLKAGVEDEGESASAISNLISRIAKQSRSADIFMLMDTQLPQELPDVRNIMSRIYVYRSSLVEVRYAMEIMGITTRTGMITNDDLYLIPSLDPGWYYLFDKNGVSLHKQVWTRSRTYLSGEDFYDIYDQVFGKTKYQDITPQLEELKSEKDLSLRAWKYRKDQETRRKSGPEEIENDEAEDDESEPLPSPEDNSELVPSHLASEALPEPQRPLLDEANIAEVIEAPKPADIAADEPLKAVEPPPAWTPKPRPKKAVDWALVAKTNQI